MLFFRFIKGEKRDEKVEDKTPLKRSKRSSTFYGTLYTFRGHSHLH